jgi:hypothetical protein
MKWQGEEQARWLWRVWAVERRAVGENVSVGLEAYLTKDIGRRTLTCLLTREDLPAKHQPSSSIRTDLAAPTALTIADDIFIRNKFCL